MARVQKAKSSVEGTVVSFEFADETVSVDFSQLSEDVKLNLGLHGLKQKLGDSTAGKDPNEALASMSKVAEALVAGNWNVRTASSGTPKIGMLVEALVRLTNKSLEEVTIMVESLDDEKIKAINAHPDVKKMKLQIKAERLEKEDSANTASIASLFA